MYSYLPFTFSFFLPRRRKSLPAAALQYRSSPCPARSAEHAITYYITSFCGFQLKKGIKNSHNILKEMIYSSGFSYFTGNSCSLLLHNIL
jgi:hypothetical protein